MRYLAALLVVLILFGVLLVAGEPAKGAEPAPVYGIASYNAYHGTPTQLVRRDVGRLVRAGADLIALQEAGRYRTAPAGYGRASGRGLAVLWHRARYSHRAHGTIVLHRSSACPACTRYAMWVRLVDRATRRAVTIVDTHMVAHVEKAGRPRPIPRVRLYRAGMSRLAELVRRVGRGTVHVAGDFNVDHDADWRRHTPYFPAMWAHRNRLIDAYDAAPGPGTGTHGSRRIDYLMHRVDGRTWPVRRAVGHGYASDHRPLLVFYR